MKKLLLIHWIAFFAFLLLIGCGRRRLQPITPNQFKGSDTKRIQTAVNKAAETTRRVVIPAINSNGSGKWLIDSAILLPSHITVILKNCTLQLSDNSRDNMFRSDNVGIGIKNPKWNYDIRIIGIGDVLLKGAKNPRATGDARKILSLDPRKDIEEGKGDKLPPHYTFTYGTDASKEGVKQKVIGEIS